jgi:hypothetical protein
MELKFSKDIARAEDMVIKVTTHKEPVPLYDVITC